MIRNKIKKEKVRVCINLDKELLEKVDNYISNLSGFFNKTLRNYIELQESNQDSDNTRLCKKIPRVLTTNKKEPIKDEPIQNEYKWW